VQAVEMVLQAVQQVRVMPELQTQVEVVVEVESTEAPVAMEVQA
jgi:hypothetical protein